jgi:hypothetical protein
MFSLSNFSETMIASRIAEYAVKLLKNIGSIRLNKIKASGHNIDIVNIIHAVRFSYCRTNGSVVFIRFHVQPEVDRILAG